MGAWYTHEAAAGITSLGCLLNFCMKGTPARTWEIPTSGGKEKIRQAGLPPFGSMFPSHLARPAGSWSRN